MYNPFSLENKTILITGATSGIGKATAVLLSNMQANLILIGRDAKKIEELKKTLNGKEHKYFQCDLKIESQMDALISDIPALDGIVFCAGIVEYLPGKFITQQKIKDIFALNFDSQLLLYQKVHKKKIINKNASLVFISSISSILGVPGTLLYASSKAALNAMVKVLASELSSSRIRVNSILPGIVKTPMTEGADSLNKEAFNEAEKAYPLGYGTPEDVACAIAFFLSDSSKWITGTNLVIDGGFTLQ